MLPTDDDLIKLFIIPADNFAENDDNSLFNQVLNVLKSCELSTDAVNDVWMPSFSTNCIGSSEFSGKSLTDDISIASHKEVIQIQTSYVSKIPDGGFIFRPDSNRSYVIDTSFVLGKYFLFKLL